MTGGDGATGIRRLRPGGTSFSSAVLGALLAACGAAYGTAADVTEGGVLVDGGSLDGTTCAKSETVCSDRVDEDCDNATDCADSDCASSPSCAAPRAKGQVCTDHGQCLSGHCADGVCCDSACTGGDCDACSVAAGARQDGTCTILSATTVCRVSAGACDAPEKCDGQSAACPPDALQPTSFVCRPSIGAGCDPAETCTAGGLACPPNTITCTTAPCSGDVACTGLPVGTACTMPTQCMSGFCVDGYCCNDACNGGPCQACSAAKGAPSNGSCALRAAGAVCRGSGNACDAPEACTGTSAACPPNLPMPDGTPCGAGNVCSNGSCSPPCTGSGCPLITTCNVNVYDTSPAVWGTLNAQVNTDGTCVPPQGKTITYTDFAASLDDGGAIYVNGARVFSGDNYVCSIKDSGYIGIPPLPAAGAPVSIRALNCVTAGAGGTITIRFFGY